MDYTTLIASKTTDGSIRRWVNHSDLDAVAVLEDAQALIFQSLRVREMRTVFTDISMAIGASSAALPSGFLDPIRLSDKTNNLRLKLRSEDWIEDRRSYSAATGTLGSNPFTTTSGSNIVTVSHTAHGQSVGFSVSFSDGSITVGGLAMTFASTVATVVDPNTYTVLHPSGNATSNATGGGATATYTYPNTPTLVTGTPLNFSIYGEALQFDLAYDALTTLRLIGFASPAVLSGGAPTNFLTNRYPHLLRSACLARAYAFRNNDERAQAELQNLAAFIAKTNMESDLTYRGLETDNWVP